MCVEQPMESAEQLLKPVSEFNKTTECKSVIEA